MFQLKNLKKNKNENYEHVNWDSVYQEAKPRKKKKHLNIYLRSLLCALIIGGVGGGMVFGSFAAGKNVYGSTAAPTAIATTTSQTSQNDTSNGEVTSGTATLAEGMTVSQVADQCTSSVVAITNKSVSETMSMFGESAEIESAGSGVIIGKNDDELLIATNYHVVEGANTLTVCFNDSEDAVYEANIKGTDSTNDLAVIAVSLSDIDDDVLKSISIATFADADNASVGDQVVAIGNALGYGQSVTSGYISALDKEVEIDANTTSTLLQTDAAINPGNSGGALFNMNGELIGINTAKFSDTTVEGMGFAIPISSAEPILEKLMTEETKSKLESGYGYLGIYGQDVDEQTAENYGLPVGIYISQVVNGSCAQAAGLQKGDIITSFNGQEISSLTELKNLLQYYKAGTQVEVTYARNTNGTYKEKTVTVTLDSEESANAGDSTADNESSQDDASQYGSGDSYGSFFGNDNGSTENGQDPFGNDNNGAYGSPYNGNDSYGGSSLEDFFSFLW
ncbi:MAG: trypsin-like peptidase domain-containing protein [Eubacterium sp.]|nr:trypsin-like peptidase domain-containing protein [Eubacterium sp.]